MCRPTKEVATNKEEELQLRIKVGANEEWIRNVPARQVRCAYYKAHLVDGLASRILCSP
jgi:hypothetical protein